MTNAVDPVAPDDNEDECDDSPSSPVTVIVNLDFHCQEVAG